MFQQNELKTHAQIKETQILLIISIRKTEIFILLCSMHINHMSYEILSNDKSYLQ